ncbi:MAG TPA: UDP-N-acetylmuramate dehydrogenase, partial [Kofleriaceae bacterium]|nr:UDP-N-acetylmuramate dehydrogenase [Kofleriaceae bacterium]
AASTTRSLLTPDDRAALAAVIQPSGAVVRFDEPMARRTTLRIGGPADAWFTPSTIDALRRVVAACAERRIPMTAVGGGSNLLVRDGGVRGLVIATRNLKRLERVGATGILTEAGVSTSRVLALAVEAELGRVEFLGGVPGSIGGGMIMNAGTYLGELKDVTTEVVSVRLADGELVRRDHAACGFVYRGSALPAAEVVVQATLELTPRPRADIEADVAGLRKRRKEREPHGVANAGSIFKNPPGDFAGRLIEAAGLKGTRVGAAECSPVHANWLVNTGGASAADLLGLIEIVRAKVREVHGVDLQLEVKVIGED